MKTYTKELLVKHGRGVSCESVCSLPSSTKDSNTGVKRVKKKKKQNLTRSLRIEEEAAADEDVTTFSEGGKQRKEWSGESHRGVEGAEA